MSLVSEIIQRGYRELNIIPLGAAPSAAQTAEALPLLNTIILQTFGNEAGDPISPINYGGEFDDTPFLGQWVPDDSRLLLNLSAEAEVNLDPYPYEGQRVAVTDVTGNLTTFNLTINGNGRNIEGATSLVLNTDGDIKQWMYREDLGDWVRIEVLEAADNMPLSEEFDDYFITALQLRLAPRYGLIVPPESQAAMAKAKSRIRSRYNKRRNFTRTDWGLVPYDEDYYGYYGNEFNIGHLNRW